MYARVLIATGQPGTMDEVVQIVNNSVVPAARQQSGFKGYFFLSDATTGKGFVLSLWETEADLRAGESSGYVREQLGKVMQYISSAPAQDAYEVSIEEMQQGGAAQYARVLSAEVQADKVGELLQITSESILPAARQQHGYKGVLFLTDATTGKARSITFWETEADMQASAASGYLQEQLPRLANVVASQVTQETYQVSVRA